MDESGRTRVHEVLEAWFMERDAEREPDLIALCDGDAALAATVQRLIDSQPEIVRNLSAPRTQPVAATDLPASSKLGEFRLIRRLGAGGMGAVYLAEQEPLGRLVALKVLDRRAVPDERAFLRFRREAEIAASLDHPNIVPIFGVGEDEGFAFLAMKYLSGPSLDRIGLPLPPDRVARIGLAVARALDEAHLAGVVHRDVKPGNIILDGDEPCVADFGLARARTDVTLTQAGVVPGTLAYMAPEQLRGGSRALDPATDIYSLGATLHELASGAPPFESADPEQLIERILLHEPPRLRLGGRNRDLETIILRALDKDRARRFQTAAAFADDLERFLRGEAIHSRSTGVFGKAARLARRHPRTAAGVLLAAVTITTLGVLARVASQRVAEHREQALAAAEAASDDGEHERAIAILEPIDDVRARALIAKARATLATDTLLDEIMNWPEAIHAPSLRAAVAEVARTSGAAPSRFATLGRAVAAWLLGDDQAAGELLDLARTSTGDGPATSALASLFRGESVDDIQQIIRNESGRPADEWVLAALAVGRMPGAPRDEGPLLAQAGDYGHPRVVLARALHAAASGHHLEAASLLEVLVRRGAARRIVWRSLARARVQLGDLAGAERALQSIPDASWTPIDAAVDLGLFCARGDGVALRRRLEEHLSRAGWGDDPTLLRAAGEIAEMEGDLASARRLLQRVRDQEQSPAARDLAIAALMRVGDGELCARRGGSCLLPPDPDSVAPLTRQDELELIAEGARSIGRMRTSSVRGRVRWFMARACIRLGKPFRAFTLLRDAIAADPTAPEPRLEMATLALDLVEKVSVPGPWTQVVAELEAKIGKESGESDLAYSLIVSEARRHASDVLREAGEGRLRLEPAQRRVAVLALTALSELKTQDAESLRRLLPEAIGLAAGGAPAEHFDFRNERLAEAWRRLLAADPWSGDDVELVPDLRGDH